MLLALQIFFAATGVSDGDLLRGVRYFAGGATTNSMVMRHQSGTGERPEACCCPAAALHRSEGLTVCKQITWLRAVRVLETQHRWERPGKPSTLVVDVITVLDTAPAMRF